MPLTRTPRKKEHGKKHPTMRKSWPSPSRVPYQNPHDGGMYIYHALAFNTLLSSQKTDAHRREVSRSPVGATQLTYSESSRLSTSARRTLPTLGTPRTSSIPNPPESCGTRITPDEGFLVAPGISDRLPASRLLRARRTLGVLETPVKPNAKIGCAPLATALNLTTGLGRSTDIVPT